MADNIHDINENVVTSDQSLPVDNDAVVKATALDGAAENTVNSFSGNFDEENGKDKKARAFFKKYENILGWCTVALSAALGLVLLLAPLAYLLPGSFTSIGANFIGYSALGSLGKLSSDLTLPVLFAIIFGGLSIISAVFGAIFLKYRNSLFHSVAALACAAVAFLIGLVQSINMLVTYGALGAFPIVCFVFGLVFTLGAVASVVIRSLYIASKEEIQLTVKVLVQVGLYIFLGIMALIVLFPFYWMLISSVKYPEEYDAKIPTLWPQRFKWSNYLAVFNKNGLNLGQLFLNTCYVGIVSTILSLIITVLAAFAFSRLEFKGKNALFAALLATMMIPGELFTVTNFTTVVAWLKWRDTFAALIVPFLVSVFYIYLLRQNFLQIPKELYLAAKVDGTSDLKYLLKVMIPLAAPTLVSITILKMMGAWNSYVWPQLVTTQGGGHWLVTVGLRAQSFVTEVQRPDYPAQMAAVVLVTIPLFLVFLFFRKYIMRGVSRSGIKG